MVNTQELHLHTRGNCDIQDVTPQIAGVIRDSGLRAGTVTAFCPGSTGGLTTIEYESGALADLQQVLDEIAPPDRDTATTCDGGTITATPTSAPPSSAPR